MTYIEFKETVLKSFPELTSLQLEQFEKMGGTYIFSRIELANAEELGLDLRGVYEHEESPFVIYLYEI